ncbi:MAG: hypothetical protein AAGB19_14405, partial [Cyanobacteria bacterium P01_F01_bin.3]
MGLKEQVESWDDGLDTPLNEFGDGLSAIVRARSDAEAVLQFNCADDAFDAALKRIGAPPLPPYIAR